MIGEVRSVGVRCGLVALRREPEGEQGNGKVVDPDGVLARRPQGGHRARGQSVERRATQGDRTAGIGWPSVAVRREGVDAVRRVRILFRRCEHQALLERLDVVDRRRRDHEPRRRGLDHRDAIVRAGQ